MIMCCGCNLGNVCFISQNGFIGAVLNLISDRQIISFTRLPVLCTGTLILCINLYFPNTITKVFNKYIQLKLIIINEKLKLLILCDNDVK